MLCHLAVHVAVMVETCEDRCSLQYVKFSITTRVFESLAALRFCLFIVSRPKQFVGFLVPTARFLSFVEGVLDVCVDSKLQQFRKSLEHFDVVVKGAHVRGQKTNDYMPFVGKNVLLF